MAFPTADNIGRPDPRFDAMVRVVDGLARPMVIADHHESVAAIALPVHVPVDVRGAFDRARSIFLYAWYDYELLVPAESQALAAFELALQTKLSEAGHEINGTMRNLIDKARKCGLLPPQVPGLTPVQDPFEALLRIRNALAHGNTDVHTPAIAIAILEACGGHIARLYP